MTGAFSEIQGQKNTFGAMNLRAGFLKQAARGKINIMKREIITLSGSTRFRDQFREVARKLSLDGKIVLAPAIYGKAEGIEHSPATAKLLYELHLDKINISDGIFVVDVGGYIGDSTRKEIAYAKSKGKSVRYYSKDFKDTGAD